jgi:hypothetical protein
MNPSALRAGAWTGLISVERVVGERVDRSVLGAHAWGPDPDAQEWWEAPAECV